MKALLLAAGLGTRLMPLTEILPKCLMPVNGVPLLEYWLRNLDEAGISSILINLHHHANKIRKHLKTSCFSSTVTAVHEDVLLQTGGTLLKNQWFFRDESIMLVHADNICLCDLKGFVSAHQKRPVGTEITMMTFVTDKPESCGIVELDHQGIVQKFHEKIHNPPGNLANAAVYILEPSIFDLLSSFQKPIIDFSTEVLPLLIGKIYTWQNKGYHRDIGTMESFALAQIEVNAYFQGEL